MIPHEQRTGPAGGDVHPKGQSLVGRPPESRLTAIFRRMVHTLVGARPDTIRELHSDEVVNSLVRLVKNIVKRERRDRDVSEQEYSHAAGYSVLKIHKLDVRQYSVVDGELRLGSVREVAKFGYEERNALLSELRFESVLEVGAGELTSLNAVMEHFGPHKRYVAFDISLNRILHGRRFLQSRGMEVTTFQGDGSRIPFPDNSFDLVFTSHSLEQMPRIFPETIREMIRVSRRHVVMFEPSYEHASFLQKLHMRSLNYVRGILPFLRTLGNVRVHPPHVMRNALNPFNRGTMFRLDKTETGAPCEPRFICPVTRGELQQFPDGYYSPTARLFYPIVRGVPILYRKYAQVVSTELTQ